MIRVLRRGTWQLPPRLEARACTSQRPSSKCQASSHQHRWAWCSDSPAQRCMHAGRKTSHRLGFCRHAAPGASPAAAPRRACCPSVPSAMPAAQCLSSIATLLHDTYLPLFMSEVLGMSNTKVGRQMVVCLGGGEQPPLRPVEDKQACSAQVPASLQIKPLPLAAGPTRSCTQALRCPTVRRWATCTACSSSSPAPRASSAGAWLTCCRQPGEAARAAKQCIFSERGFCLPRWALPSLPVSAQAA